MQKRTQWALLLAILVLAAALRWTGLDWDDYNHYHPDERYITWVATTIEWPDDWRTALVPAQSTFNPFHWPPDAVSESIVVPQGEPRDFAYGHVPLYLGVMAARVVEWLGPGLRALLPDAWLVTRDVLNAREAVEFRHLTAVSRALTGLFDVATVLVVFLLGRRVFGPAVGLLAAALLALSVMHIQLAHFFTVDPYLTFFVATAVYFMVRGAGAQPARRAGFNLLLAALFVGLAVGAKFSAVLLLVPLAVAAWLALPQSWLRWLLAAGGVTAVTFILTNPFAVLDFSCEVITAPRRLGPVTIPALDWRSCYLDNITTQSAMVRGDLDLGFTRQYAGTLPYLYFIEMQLRWGLGWPLGLLAFAGLGWAAWRGGRMLLTCLRAWRAGHECDLEPGLLIMLAWVLPYFLVTGSFYVKFMRYMQPITPFLVLFGSALLWQWRQRAGRAVLAGVLVAGTAVYALAFVNIYNADHPWNVASRWVYANVPPGTLIASEQWDDALPTTMIVDGEPRRRSEYRDEQLTWLTGPDALDDPQKLDENLTLLARAEYVTLLSNRVYGVVPRLPERYPLSSQAHQLLFDGSLGYEPVFVAGRAPNLAGFYFKPDPFAWPGLTPPPLVTDTLAEMPGLNGGRFDESFTVYDQPLVIVFRNVAQRSPAEMRIHFEGVSN